MVTANGDEDTDSVSHQTRDADTPDAGASIDDIGCVEILKREQNGGDLSLRFDVERTKVIWSRRSTLSKENPVQGAGNETPAAITADAGVTNTDDGDKAVDALARVIEKKDFAEMSVIGQFNLGFIIVRRGIKKTRKGSDNSDDLFIVDQHAADEKYNFETLQATTKIESQKLFRPRPLELTASDEMLAKENIDILKQNGFEIDVDPEDAISEGSRLMLTAQPVSKSTTFDMKDLEEVIHLLRDRPGGQMVRCSKARAMFAMRACRKSVMVGMPLTLSQMTSVVRHMGTMDQPWNCPHGRPTMRHLTDIRSRDSRSKEDVDWSSFQ
ncbi:hypothetical protein HYPSUDRAFT_147301 [Hypholoma sublateritium FD-334 SS-4]|uniref:MutL C-terminal dimerisation domain-containing protein n=1 Tax=Hypholoma sublateritium (strain FD-334 SS-4) TaxID=945553 RepID=A0A0D2KQ72_HYPSF|nr:hypothetical protein HYPSUDRAFT_147301 [Hypholoma sublateritium FD-334 SS-4]